MTNVIDFKTKKAEESGVTDETLKLLQDAVREHMKQLSPEVVNSVKGIVTNPKFLLPETDCGEAILKTTMFNGLAAIEIKLSIVSPHGIPEEE